MRYIVVLHKEPESDYGVTVPDLPGCFSGGETVDEALAMAKEAIEAHIETTMELGFPVPELKAHEEHLKDPDFVGGIWYFVDVDPVLALGKTARYNLTLPELLVERVDQYLATNPTVYRSRSDFFAHVAADHLLQR